MTTVYNLMISEVSILRRLLYTQKPSSAGTECAADGPVLNLPREPLQLILRPCDHLRDRLTVTQPRKHLVVHATVIDLHGDLGCRFRRRQ